MRCKWYQVVVFLSFPYFLHTPPSPLHVCFPCVCFIGRKLEGSVHFGSPSTSCGGSPSECLQGSVCKTKNWKRCKKKDKKTSNENRFVSLIPIWVILMRFLMRLFCQKDFVETKRYAFHGCWVLLGRRPSMARNLSSQTMLYQDHKLNHSWLHWMPRLRELPGAPWCMDYVWK